MPEGLESLLERDDVGQRMFAPLADDFYVGLIGVEGGDAAVEDQNFMDGRIVIEEVEGVEVGDFGVIAGGRVGGRKRRECRRTRALAIMKQP